MTRATVDRAVGLTNAVVTILVMLTAYFESPRLALAAVSAGATAVRATVPSTLPFVRSIKKRPL